jgi:hypothetical protein
VTVERRDVISQPGQVELARLCFEFHIVLSGTGCAGLRKIAYSTAVDENAFRGRPKVSLFFAGWNSFARLSTI